MNEPAIGVVDALKRAAMRMGDVVPSLAFDVRPGTHSQAEAIQAVLWTCGAALELRRCPEA